jgi:hypothetical protein
MNFGREPTEDWTVNMENIPEWCLAKALKLCFARDTAWPPILGEFTTICNSIPAHENPNIKQIRRSVGRGEDCPERSAFIDTQKSRFSPGDDGYTEFFEERKLYHYAMERKNESG